MNSCFFDPAVSQRLGSTSQRPGPSGGLPKSTVRTIAPCKCGFTVGSGIALFGPVWQVSASEQALSEALPSAVALNSSSYNIARSFGPAIGRVIVAAAANAAFARRPGCFVIQPGQASMLTT